MYAKSNEDTGIVMSHVDTVVVGRFNPFIVSPQWLAKQRILVVEGTPQVMVRVGEPQVGFQFTIDQFVWQVDLNRLVVASLSRASPAPYVKQVIEILPHTPLTAVGHNFAFTCSSSAWRGGTLWPSDLIKEKLHDYGDIQLTQWSCSIQRSGPLVINAKLTQAQSEVQINLNFHRAAGDLASALAALDSYESDVNAAHKLAALLCGEVT